MREHINIALKILNKIFDEGTYSNMALNDAPVSDMATKLIYGVLDENVKIEYILSSLIDKKPKKTVYVLLKIGTYALLNLTNVPSYAIVSECVEVAKMNGKGGASGFVNAVLKKVSSRSFQIPKETDGNYLSVTYSKPQWFVDKLISQYGYEQTVAMFESDYDKCEHIRVNSLLTSLAEVEQILKNKGTQYRESEVGGLIVKIDDVVKRLFSKGSITYQSPSSILAVRALSPKDGDRTLDLCSAPGGKAVYIAELCPNGEIVACDLHGHRVSLIEKYKKRMHVSNVKCCVKDATKFDKDFENAFDRVLVDAPCSCFGTYRKHPDVFLSKDGQTVKELSALQRQVLDNASRYLKEGGVLVYSTCTLFKEENEDVVNGFLNSHKNFSLERIGGMECIDNGRYTANEGTVQILPHNEYDGFFIAKLRKNYDNKKQNKINNRNNSKNKITEKN